MDDRFLYVVAALAAVYILNIGLADAQQYTRNSFCNNSCDNNICRGQPNNTAIPNNASCTEFFICVDEHPVPNTCPPGQWFNPETCLCDESENEECNKDDEFKCPPSGIYFFPHEEYCDKFIMCFAGVPILSHCADGLYFDRELLACNLPEYAECGLEICPQNNDPTDIIFIPSEVDCEKFYICYLGEAIEQRCAPGIHWNAATEQCDFPENANCTIGKPESPQYPEPHEIDCDSEGVYFLPHPNSCGHYFICSHGESILLECAPNFHFDIHNDWCDFPDSVDCTDDGQRLNTTLKTSTFINTVNKIPWTLSDFIEASIQ